MGGTGILGNKNEISKGIWYLSPLVMQTLFELLFSAVIFTVLYTVYIYIYFSNLQVAPVTTKCLRHIVWRNEQVNTFVSLIRIILVECFKCVISLNSSFYSVKKKSVQFHLHSRSRYSQRKTRVASKQNSTLSRIRVWAVGRISTEPRCVMCSASPIALLKHPTSQCECVVLVCINIEMR